MKPPLPEGAARLIQLRDIGAIWLPDLRPQAFGRDNWGKVNRFDLVFDGPPIGLGPAFVDTAIARSFRMVFADGQDWDATPFFTAAMKRIDAGLPRWGCATRAALLHRLNTDIRALHASMHEHGFLTQEQIGARLHAGDAKALERFARGYSASLQPSHNIKIGLNEAGQVLFLDGRHRLAIALVLDLTPVPVRVVFRHADWHQIRQAIRAASGPGAAPWVAEHPDLEHLAVPDAALPALRETLAARGLRCPAFRPATA